jgi:hypothetical protein
MRNGSLGWVASINNGITPALFPWLARTMADLPILPGSTVVVRDNRSIYNGYKGFVQRISGVQAAVLFEGGNWDKLVTMPLKTLEQV